MFTYFTRPIFWFGASIPRILAYILAYMLLAAVYGYRFCIAPLLGVNCRFQPSCSQYAITALTRHGGFYGTCLVIKRLVRCRPHIHECYGVSYGYDPVPMEKPDKASSTSPPLSTPAQRDKA